MKKLKIGDNVKIILGKDKDELDLSLIKEPADIFKLDYEKIYGDTNNNFSIRL